MPWIEPAATDSETSLLALTGPNALLMPLSSIAGCGLFTDAPRSHRALGIRHVVVDLDGAGDDVGAGLVGGGLHLGRDQRLVVVVEGPADAVLFQPEHRDAGLPGAVA